MGSKTCAQPPTGSLNLAGRRVARHACAAAGGLARLSPMAPILVAPDDWQRSCCCWALGADASPSSAQGPTQLHGTGLDGRPITRRCHADVGDLEGLKATLIEHEKARIGFKNKIRHGVFSGGRIERGADQERAARPRSLR